MTTDTRLAREREAGRRQQGVHMQPEQQAIDAQGTGTESIEYEKPTIDPQWLNAWKLFLNRDGQEVGMPVRVPRKQYFEGGPNALENQRRHDGGYWFTLVEPDVVLDPVNYPYECFVGSCQKKLDSLDKVPPHVRTFHYDEARPYEPVLQRIENTIIERDPRLQAMLAQIEEQASEMGVTSEAVEAMAREATSCHSCGEKIEGKLADHVCAED